MPIVDNQDLYDKVKTYANSVYSKPSAYKSGFIVKTYKELGGTYTEDNKPKNLERWYKEEWKDIGDKSYPVYRPTKRINKDTPLTIKEIDSDNLKKQIKLKQKIKGDSNLPKFKKKDNIVDIIPAVKKNKKYTVIMDDGKQYSFGYSKSKTYLDEKDIKKKENYWKRHYIGTEKELIDNLVPSPSLFSAVLLWGKYTNLEDNIKFLNSLWENKKNIVR